MKQCEQCGQICYGRFCSHGCAEASVLNRCLEHGVFLPDAENEIRRLAKELEGTRRDPLMAALAIACSNP